MTLSATCQRSLSFLYYLLHNLIMRKIHRTDRQLTQSIFVLSLDLNVPLTHSIIIYLNLLSGTVMRDSTASKIEIPTANLGFLTTTSSDKVRRPYCYCYFRFGRRRRLCHLNYDDTYFGSVLSYQSTSATKFRQFQKLHTCLTSCLTTSGAQIGDVIVSFCTQFISR